MNHLVCLYNRNQIKQFFFVNFKSFHTISHPIWDGSVKHINKNVDSKGKVFLYFIQPWVEIRNQRTLEMENTLIYTLKKMNVRIYIWIALVLPLDCIDHLNYDLYLSFPSTQFQHSNTIVLFPLDVLIYVLSIYPMKTKI